MFKSVGAPRLLQPLIALFACLAHHPRKSSVLRDIAILGSSGEQRERMSSLNALSILHHKDYIALHHTSHLMSNCDNSAAAEFLSHDSLKRGFCF